MNNIFKYKSENVISIDILELIKRQILINDKFPNPNRDTKFINIYDNMAGQINEEIFETIEALKNNTIINKDYLGSKYQSHESLEEFIDTIMYIGSLIVESSISLEIDIESLLEKYKLTEIDICDFYVPNNFKEYNRNKPNNDFLSYIRRKIYDRKYHKPCSLKPDNYEENIILYIIIGAFSPRINDVSYAGRFEKYKIPGFIDNMNPYIQDVFFCYDNGTTTDDKRKNNIISRLKELNKIINEKQNFISSL